MQSKAQILTIIRKELPFEIDAGRALNDDTVLTELGCTSMELITVLLTLQREYGITLDAVINGEVPTTVGDLVRLFHDTKPT